MSDVWRNVLSSHAPSPANEPDAFCARVLVVVSRSTFALNSSSVSSARPAYCGGRAIGMACAESPDHVPWRSGSPHGVFGTVHGFPAFAGSAGFGEPSAAFAGAAFAAPAG